MATPTRIDFPAAHGTITYDDGTTHAGVMAGTFTLDPAPAKATCRFGVDPSRSTTADFAADIADFPGALVGAAYGGAGEGCLPWTSPWVAPMVKAGYRVQFSAKDYTNIASFVANWDAMPAPRPGMGIDEFDYIPFHECNRPTGGPNLTTWKASFAALIKARDAHKNAARIKLGPNFSWWPAEIAHNEGIPWESFIGPGIDFVSWDQYWGGGMGVYADLDKFTELPDVSRVGLSKTDTPLPVWIREFGVSDSQSDATAAKVIADIAPVYVAKGFQSVSYFQYRSGVSGAWLTKTNRPLAFAAWQRVCAGQ